MYVGSGKRHPLRVLRRVRGRGIFDSIGSIVKSLSGLAKTAAPVLKIATPIVKTIGTHYLSKHEAQQKAALDTKTAQEKASAKARIATQAAAEKASIDQQAAQAASALAHQQAMQSLELEQKRKGLLEEERARERARLQSAASQSGQSITQSREVAASFADQMRARYPAAFKAFPNLYSQTEGQVLAAQISPADPTDAMYLNKVLGEIEFNIATTSHRLDPTSAEPAPLLAAAKPKASRSKASAGLLGFGSARRRRGGGLLSVIHP